MKTRTYNVYEFDELSDKAKERAREWFREQFFSESLDYKYLMDNFHNIAALFGLMVDNVYFSGFSTQGDGASFRGFYSYKPGSLEAVKSECPQNEDLHSIVSRLQDLQKKNFYQLEARITTSGRYCHEYSMNFDMSRKDGKEVAIESEKEFCEIMRDYARWCYNVLEIEYNYQTSDDVVDENILANEYTFLIDGTREE